VYLYCTAAVYAHMEVCMCCLDTLVGWINMLTEELIMMSFDILNGMWLLKESI